MPQEPSLPYARFVKGVRLSSRPSPARYRIKDFLVQANSFLGFFTLKDLHPETFSGSAIIENLFYVNDVRRAIGPPLFVGFVVDVVLRIEVQVVSTFLHDLDFAPYLIADHRGLEE